MALISVKLFGSAHAEEVGALVKGLPAGLVPDMELLESMLRRRAPGRFAWTSARSEEDLPQITEGLCGGKTDGAPLRIIIKNNDVQRSAIDYRRFPRPSHADYPAAVKSGGALDLSGGGPFSARLTAPLVAAGALMKGWLGQKGIRIYGRVQAVGGIFDSELDAAQPDEAALAAVGEKDFPTLDSFLGEKMIKTVLAAKEKGDSLGGLVQCVVFGLPAGSGGFFNEGLESLLAKELFAIPGVRGLEFGGGFALAGTSGHAANDELYFDENKTVKTYTNHSGGINGGLANGMPLVFTLAFRPTPSIALPQRSVDLQEGVNTVISVSGRHDSCIAPRAVPVAEAAAAIALAGAMGL